MTQTEIRRQQVKREKNRRQYLNRVRQGKCPKCLKPAKPGRKHCEKCLLRERTRYDTPRG